MTQAPETPTTDFVTIFDDTYDQPDCRAYFRMMDALGYRNQHHAVAAFHAGLDELMRLRGLARPRVFDFASSYGIVSLLMGWDVTLDAVFRRYRAPHFEAATPQEVMARDRDWLAGLRRDDASIRFSGLDVMPNAVAYAGTVGLFEAGFAEDLETAEPSAALAAELSTVDMIVECGSVAQLMPRALDRMLAACGPRKPWLMTSPIRGNERSTTDEVLRAHGLVQEVLPVSPFVHRRFENADEQARAIANARAAGHETDGVETTGHFHAQVLLARPESERTPPDTWRLPLSVPALPDAI
ncbi:hypothetical protein [Roseovarius sp. D22-M7]|uniref:hypothetical protein n=1 Tax=Roseovarius sp. D22-M7 TaxID=3127116 RepID=UPI0030101B8C